MIRKPRKTAGVIGLGIIGMRAAAGLRAAGFQTFVWNRTPQPAPNFLPTPGDVAAAADIIQIFVADAQALFDVLEGMKERMTAQHLIICSATVGPEATVEAARLVHERGAQFLDAPFTGSLGAAERRQLAFYVGGEEAAFLRAKPVLDANSKAIVRIGAVGDAAIVKVVTNMISAVSIQALAEALAIVRKAGLPDEVLSAALEQNACRSQAMEMKLPKMISEDYEPHFSLKHMFKDVQLGIQMANALDVDCPAASVTAGALFGGMKHGWGDLDFSAIFKTYGDLRPRVHALEAAPSPEIGPADVASTPDLPLPVNPERSALDQPTAVPDPTENQPLPAPEAGAVVEPVQSGVVPDPAVESKRTAAEVEPLPKKGKAAKPGAAS